MNAHKYIFEEWLETLLGRLSKTDVLRQVEEWFVAEARAIILVFENFEEIPCTVIVQHQEVLFGQAHIVTAQKVLPKRRGVDHAIKALLVGGHRLLAERWSE